MAPSKKKSVNKRFLSEVSTVKEIKKSNRNKPQKKKLSDRLGPQWSKGELQRFYRAYRDYGRNWKKVAIEVRNRSVEMVEALYNMNRAYLSLPEGIASVVGLVAMMTDHYCVLEASDSERESDEMPEVSKKIQMRKRAKVYPSALKEEVQQPRLYLTTGRCLSLLKSASFNGGQPRAVGKRTPRFPISHANSIPPRKKCRISDDAAAADDAARAVAMVLAQASNQGGSPNVSSTPKRQSEQMKLSPRSCNEVSETDLPELYGYSIYENGHEGSTAVRMPDINVHTKGTSSLLEMEGVQAAEVRRKGKKFYGKEAEVDKVGNIQANNDGEAYNNTEGQNLSTLKGNVDSRFPLISKLDETCSQSERKSSKMLVSGDDLFAMDPLQTLAHVFLMDSEPSAEPSDRLNNKRATCVDGNFSIPEGTSTDYSRDKTKLSKQKVKAHHASSEDKGTTTQKSRPGKCSAIQSKPVGEATEQPQPINSNMSKRKRHMISTFDAETPVHSRPSKISETEDLERMEKFFVAKGKHSGHISTPSKQLKSVGVSEVSSFCGNHQSAERPFAESSAEAPVTSQIISTTKKANRRKMHLKSALTIKKETSFENIPTHSVQGSVPFLKERISCCLSSSMVLRWCVFEWFYSAIDYPWFAKREFVEYLNHVGLGHIPTLTRYEWCVIRSSLGKPRRFSAHFLQEEKEKLQQYRESVRKHYAEVQTGIREGLPTDLARPLSVGQRVIAIHPKTRELHDGSVLTVGYDRCRVQFDNPGIGVEFVKDVDCMPSNPLDNMPEALRTYMLSTLSKEQHANGQPNAVGFSSVEPLQKVTYPMNTLVKPTQVYMNQSPLQAKPAAVDVVNPPQLVHAPSPVVELIKGKESDVQTLSSLMTAKDKQSSPCSSDASHASQESGSTVLEIIRVSESKANTMVDAAIQAFSSIKGGEDAYMRIREALDSTDRRRLPSESRQQVIKSLQYANGISHHPNHLISGTPEYQGKDDPSGSNSHDDSDSIKAAIPSQLISSCVATMIMLQTCTERQYPPNDVARVIDYAVNSLHPCCPQNLPIYREVQMSMGRIKNQILALIPLHM